jgi:hypothetical protein
MDGVLRLHGQLVSIGRHFEESRLERDLLASAYEQAVPLIRRRGVPLKEFIDNARVVVEEQPLAAIGG